MATFKAPGHTVPFGRTGLWRFYRYPVAHCVWIDPDDGVHESSSPLDWDLKNAKPGSGDFGNAVFRRGRTYTVTSEEQSLLEGAGYTVNE